MLNFGCRLMQTNESNKRVPFISNDNARNKEEKGNFISHVKDKQCEHYSGKLNWIFLPNYICFSFCPLKTTSVLSMTFKGFIQ